MAFQEIVPAIADKVFGTAIYNKFVNNVNFLKSIFETEHLWSTGIHKRNGFYAFATLYGAGAAAPTTSAATSYNVGAVTYNGVGLYTVDLNADVPDYSAIVTGCAITNRAVSGVVLNGKAQFAVTNLNTGAAVNLVLSPSQLMYFAVIVTEKLSGG